MIEELRLGNFASITAELDFSPNFNVIIGETGAGKSLLLSAISFLKGDKLSFPAEECFVEAVFSTPEGEVFARREIKAGRSRCFLDGMRVPQKLLAERVSPLIVFQSQRQSIELLKPSVQLEILDRLAENEELPSVYRAKFEAFKKEKEKLEELERKVQDRDRQIDILKFQIEEIREANLREGEEEELLELRNLLRQSEKIKEVKELVRVLIYEGEGSALERISEVISRLEKIEGSEELLERLRNAYYELEDICSEIERKLYVPDEEVSLDEIEDRLYEIEKLKRKYGSSIAEINAFLKEAEEKLYTLENLEFEIEEERKRLEALEAELKELASEISERRKRAAEEFEAYVVSTLKELGMPEVRFKVEFREKELSATGVDEVQFLFSGNPSLPLSPLSASISGGELSRFLLTILSKVSVPGVTMVFDEIDAGMSGKTLSLVAAKLKEIAKNQQVIAVTHSPQVVAAADRVFKVEKKNGNVAVREVKKEQIEREIAIMISGDLTDKSLEAARDLIRRWEE
ncbi:DNA repair protein RecN (Recombination protein N) [Desulfurobacterium pacificum]|uniref:DNA repair protein RecN n=1 Tax=Desulfurobacterium pacificum TaxID=240166 RepID=A0ABY1NMA8_9BACT|nr:AAA family ATPase [Desulfurobacterium pacificum]SMP13453.1 DNA repair protein RecN (Recombination protein N) [Desulfurobacterium pacificum]